MKSVEDVMISWLNHIQDQGQYIVRNSDMKHCRDYSIKYFGKETNASSFEREFRSIRKKWPHRFEDVSEQYPDRTEKTWKIKKKDK